MATNLRDRLLERIEEVGEKIDNIKECIIFQKGFLGKNHIICNRVFDLKKLNIDSKIDYSSLNSIANNLELHFGIIIFKDGCNLQKEHDSKEWKYFYPATIENFINFYGEKK